MTWQQIKNRSIDELLDWSEDQPWARAMSQCKQDGEWHAEGDVWTHTKMVCRELVKLEEWDSLSSDEQEILMFTALFHDVAKPITTQEDPESGRVSSPKHAVKGERIARQILRDLGCDLGKREQIANMVRYHGRPAFLTERLEPPHEVVRLSWLVENRLLYLFALADTRGRLTQSMTRPEENLHYWRMQSEEMACYRNRFHFENSQARFLFLSQRSSNLFYVPHLNFGSKVTMICGLPGSGKDTWLKAHRGDLPVVSLDEIRRQMGISATDNQGIVVQRAREECRRLLRSGTDFAFNATNVVRQTRTRWIDLFVDYNAFVELVYLEPPIPRLLDQNARRPTAVPNNVILKLADKCQPPNWNECHHLLITDGVEAI